MVALRKSYRFLKYPWLLLFTSASPTVLLTPLQNSLAYCTQWEAFFLLKMGYSLTLCIRVMMQLFLFGGCPHFCIPAMSSGPLDTKGKLKNRCVQCHFALWSFGIKN